MDGDGDVDGPRRVEDTRECRGQQEQSSKREVLHRQVWIACSPYGRGAEFAEVNPESDTN